MKKIVLLILLNLPLLSQDVPLMWWYSGQQENYTIPTATIVTSTGVPVPYDDFCMQLTIPQYAKINHFEENRILSTTDFFEYRIDVYRESGGVIFGQHLTGGATATNIRFYWTANTLSLYIGDTIYTAWESSGTDLNQWIRYKILFASGVLSVTTATPLTQWTDENDTVRFSRVTTMPNCTGGTLHAFAFGSPYELVTSGFSDVATGGNFTGKMDNFYARIDVADNDSVLSVVNFNDGVYGMDSLNYWKLYGGNQHDIVTKSIYFGYSVMSDDPYDPQIVRRSGGRKDANRWFNLGVGLRAWSSLGYSRASDGNVRTNPYDPTQLIFTGVFNCNTDSSDLISQNVVSYSSVTRTFTNMGTFGIGAGFGFNSKFLNDSEVVVIGIIDTADGIECNNIAKWNFGSESWDNMGNGIDTLMTSTIEIHEDTVWVMDGSRLRFWTSANDTFTTYYVFPNSANSNNICIGWGHNTLLVFRRVEGIYRRVGSTMELWIGPVTLTTVFEGGASTGGSEYNAFYWDSTEQRAWFGGDWDTLGGVYCKEICYVTADGVPHYVAEMQDLYQISGWVTAIKKWQGTMIILGMSRRIVNSGDTVYASNIWGWDEVRGAFPLDYGLPYIGFGMDVYENDGYEDLVVYQDGQNFNGLKTNLTAGRYSEEHFAVLEPIITYTFPAGDITEFDFPITIAPNIYSPASRSVTSTLYYFKNYNGTDTTEVVFTKTDSTLSNLKGCWDFDLTAQMTDIGVAPEDTVYARIEAVDSLGNTSIQSWKIPIKAPAMPLTDLELWFKYDTLSNGAVSLWPSASDTLKLRQGTGSVQPTKGATGITFDGGDMVQSTSTLNYGTTAFTVHMVVKIVDTTHTSPPLSHQYLHFKNGTRIIEFLIFNSSVGANRFRVQLYNGSNWNNSKYFPLSAIRKDKYSLYTITYDGTNTINLYVNNVLISGTVLASSGFTNEGFYFGDFGGVGRYVPNGTGLRDIVVFNAAQDNAARQSVLNYFDGQGDIDP